MGLIKCGLAVAAVYLPRAKEGALYSNLQLRTGPTSTCQLSSDGEGDKL